jgi:hypothetical protein
MRLNMIEYSLFEEKGLLQHTAPQAEAEAAGVEKAAPVAAAAAAAW